VLVFPESYAARRAAEGALIEIRDAGNRVVRFDRDRRRNLLKLTAPAGRFIAFQYDARDRIVAATDHERHSVRYDYDSGGRLVAVTDQAGHVIRYVYDGANLVMVDGGDSASGMQARYFGGRVSELRLASDRVYRFRFNFDEPGASHATSALVTDPEGNITEVDIRTGVVRRVGGAR